jgi:hypothetical protein
MAEKFSFKSTKGQDVKVEYTPTSAVKISDKTAFQKYLLKIVDFIQVDDKKKEDKPKSIEKVAEEVKPKESDSALAERLMKEIKSEVKK